jgi:hypothetical protein
LSYIRSRDFHIRVLIFFHLQPFEFFYLLPFEL